MEVFLEAGHNYAFLLELIVHYLKLEERKKVTLIHLSQGALMAIKNKKLLMEVPSLITSEGNVQTQIFQICKQLFSILPHWKSFFLGEEVEAAEIAQIKVHLKQGKELRKHLQKHLESRTFFVGSHITFADFYMFTQLYDNMIDMSDQQKIQYNNLFRWYKHFQNLPQVREYLTKTNRFFLEDPISKHHFLTEKKKPKKDKKDEEQKPEKKQHSKEEVKAEQKSVSEAKTEQPASATTQLPSSKDKVQADKLENKV